MKVHPKTALFLMMVLLGTNVSLIQCMESQVALSLEKIEEFLKGKFTAQQFNEMLESTPLQTMCPLIQEYISRTERRLKTLAVNTCLQAPNEELDLYLVLSAMKKFAETTDNKIIADLLQRLKNNIQNIWRYNIGTVQHKISPIESGVETSVSTIDHALKALENAIRCATRLKETPDLVTIISDYGIIENYQTKKENLLNLRERQALPVQSSLSVSAIKSCI